MGYQNLLDGIGITIKFKEFFKNFTNNLRIFFFKGNVIILL